MNSHFRRERATKSVVYQKFTQHSPLCFFCFAVLPEQPVVLDRWGRQLNSTKIGPKEEGEDIILSCRVVGGKITDRFRRLAA